MAGNFTPTPRKKVALDNKKLSLYAPCPSAPGKISSLSWRLVSNNPRIDVYTNDPADMTERNKNGLISAALDAPVFFSLMQILYQTIDAPGVIRNKIENKNFIFPGGKRSDKPVITGEIIVGKDEDGVIWISVLAYDKERPKIKFQLLPTDFHNYFHGDGSVYGKGEISKLYAKGFIRLLEGIMTHLLVTEYVEPEKKPTKEGGYSKSNNQSSNDRGDDDLLF